MSEIPSRWMLRFTVTNGTAERFRRLSRASHAAVTWTRQSVPSTDEVWGRYVTGEPGEGHGCVTERRVSNDTCPAPRTITDSVRLPAS